MRFSDAQRDNSVIAGGGTKALSIVGTTLGGIALANQSNHCGNGGILGNILGGGNHECYETKEAACLREQVAELRSMRYTDSAVLDLYAQSVRDNKELTAAITALSSRVSENDKSSALNRQASDYQFVIANNRIGCENDKLRAYVDATFVPGNLVMPLDSICPAAEPA